MAEEVISGNSFRCPHCDKVVGIEHFACQSGQKGGAAGVGESKVRSREQCVKAALMRWHKKKVYKV